MNDITALMATMKAAAEKATPGEWCVFSHPASGTYAVHTPKDKRCEDVIKWPGFDGQQNAAGNAEFIAAANPANVLALVEALEKAQQQNVIQREYYDGVISDGSRRIASLESEVKFPGVMRCNTCGFSRSHVVVTAGGMVAGKSEPERCPNGCGPMWHDTYRHQYNELYDAYKSLESRTVTVKLPELHVGVVQSGHAVMVPYPAGHWFNKTAIFEMLADAGIQAIEGEGQHGGNCE